MRTTKSSGNNIKTKPHYVGHRERLRARFREAGSDAVSDYELLELILFRTIPQRDLKPLAKELIAKFGSFGEVLAAPQPRLEEVKGIKEATATDAGPRDMSGPAPATSPADLNATPEEMERLRRALAEVED